MNFLASARRVGLTHQCTRAYRWRATSGRVAAILCLLLLAWPGRLDAQILTDGRQPAVIPENKHDVLPRLSDLHPAPAQARARRTIRLGRIKPSKPSPRRMGGLQVDPVVQSAPSRELPITQGLSFEGIGDGVDGYMVEAAPPDPNGAAGLTQFVEMVNTAFAVYSKSTGALVYGPVDTSTLWIGFGGACEENNDGDGIVQYDRIAHRWVLSQFANVVSSFPPFYQCIAVSQSEDATGAWNRYSFSYSDVNDYPKMAVWPDAYYETYNMFGAGPSGDYLGSKVCALDRAAMLAGTTTTQVCFDLATQYGGVLASDLDGYTLPPAAAPNYLVGYQTGTASQLNVWKFHVDFTTPANSTLTGPTSVPVAYFNEGCAGDPCDTNVVTQPDPSTMLDTMGDRPMYRLAYRNFGDHESMVFNHTVLTGNGIAAVRWYELRSPGTTPVVYQQSTWAPHEYHHRFMGSIAMDGSGNMALAYSVSSSMLYPSIRYVGRTVSDALNWMDTEYSIWEGTASQTGGMSRWGDYTSMVVDPNDDCTFWYTNQYVPSDGLYNWRTRVASLKFPFCTSPAAMIAPQPGATLGGTTATFSWTTGTAASSYWISMGTSPGGVNLYDAGQGTNTSATINNLPANGSTVYVRLFSFIEGVWRYHDYTYKAANLTPVKATLTSPTAGSALSGSSVTFTWNTGTNVTGYWLWIGTIAGTQNLYDANQGTNTSVTVNNLPTNGRPVYVRLFSRISGTYQYNDYTFTAYTPPPVPASMASPTPGSSLTGFSTKFTWTTGTGVSSYWLWIGTAPGTLNLYDANQGANTSVTLNNLPTNGITLYVRLFSKISGVFQYNDYTYQAFQTVPATMITPAQGTTLTGSSATFTWTTGTGVSSYTLWIGTSLGALNLYDAGQGTNTSATVNGLPANGMKLYVRLYSVINGTLQYRDSYYWAYSPPPVKAAISSPTPGSTLTGSSAGFTWTSGTKVTSYWLWIGTMAGTQNLYDANQGTNTSVTVNGLPTNGRTLYVRLFSVINGALQYNDYTYTAYTPPPAPAAMITPVNGSTLHGSSMTFTWTTGTKVTSYWLWIGTTAGRQNLYDANQGTNTSVTVNGLPTNGSTIYVRLFSIINGALQYNDYAYVTGP